MLPDAVHVVPESERIDRTWGRDPLLQVQGIGAFVRVLLPIQLTGGFSLTVGTWLSVDPASLREVWEVWETPAYAELVLEGHLANAVPPWGQKVLGIVGVATVRDPTKWPYIQRSDAPSFQNILSTEWPHDAILGAYASVFRRTPPTALEGGEGPSA
ncbi:MAG: DUF2199 domain-containing protein [Actinomycetota bacterium]|nr:DUF2199 domain-containing protein [Actinomycetota bacterium]